MNVQNIDIVQGDDRTITLTAKDAAFEIKNLTGGTIAWKVAKCLGDDGIISKAGSIVSAVLGTFTVALTDTDTDQSDLPPGDYIHQARLTISGVTTSVVQGRFRVRGEIT